MTQYDNLNEFAVETTDGRSYLRMRGAVSNGIEVVFDDLEDRLIRLFHGAEMVLGCVAWLTNRRILRVLSAVPHVSIVVQKEDFLRPDVWESTRYREDLRALYDALHTSYNRMEMDGVISDLSTSGDPSMTAVRCAGNYNRDKNPLFPRMHHKFVLIRYDGALTPDLVWTGSFNFTQNAARSFENAVILRDEQIVSAYYSEFSHIYALSEPLDWTWNWVAPEYRIGT